MATPKHILLVHKKSTLELMQQGNECAQIYLNKFPKRKAELERADVANRETLTHIKSHLDSHNCSYHECHRAKICTDELQKVDLIISVGGDGTLLDVAKFVTDIKILGVNSDPVKSTGFFCHATKETFIDIFENLDTYPTTTLPRMKLFVDNKEFEHPILNDIFFTNKNHADMIRMEGVVDNSGELFFRSSGLLISTANGSTAWMYNEGGEIMKSNDNRLQFRESGSRVKKAGFVQKEITLTSHMYAGIIAIDGSHQLRPFSFGTQIRVEPGAAPLTVYGDVDGKKNLE